MFKKIISSYFFIVVLFLATNGWGNSSPVISITGLVRQPIHISMDDLSRFEAVNVRLNEIKRDRKYHGAFNYHGIPLRTLLELASIQKEETDFPKQVDLAVVIRNKNGDQTVLSWGEVFYRNPAEIIIAFSAIPIIPHKTCKDCHNPEFYQKWISPLNRQVGLPKLVVANDFYSDRSIEDITNIEVVDLHPKMVVQKLPELFSPRFTITGSVKQILEFADLSSYPHLEIAAKQIGDGKGYHGLRNFRGVSLLELLDKAGIEPDLNTVLLVSAPDGYRSLISYGELFLNPEGRNIIIAYRVDDQPIMKTGKFVLIMPNDLSADRWVKAVSKIEAIQLKQHAKLYIIGIGCADTNLITSEAISYMGKSDVFVSTEDIAKRFSKYMGNKPVLFDPLMNAESFFRKKNPDLSDAEVRKRLEEQRSQSIQMIRDALNNNKNVAFLEYGDPTIFGSWIYWLQEFTDQIEIIPGLSAFNVSNAMIKKHFGCNGSIILTVPRGLEDNEAMLKAVAENGDTLVIFIGLKEMKNLMPLFQKYYSETTPVKVVYRAGYSDSERLISTTLKDVMNITEKEEEQHLGMIYIGPCLK
jgi:precorrin-4 methylase/DMSO/TMAO reductase YedYZ molybdopterin-dependent catalytic subunit